VNLLLVAPEEITDAEVVLADRRAEHLRGVLGSTVGSQVRTGIVGGGIGTAEVVADDGHRITLRLAITAPAPPPLPIGLVLAVPRPKALTRVIEAVASFGVEWIALTNAWRVDKSYLHSPRLAPDALAQAARLGAEQGATTHLPAISIHRRLMELLDARWPALETAGPETARPETAGPETAGPETAGDEVRLIAHPGGKPIERAVHGGPVTLAIGPEGGWIPREVETFVERGFVAVSLGSAILRVETAVAAALGQLVLLDRVRAR
jgi:RsmE family RNA methyltransferase